MEINFNVQSTKMVGFSLLKWSVFQLTKTEGRRAVEEDHAEVIILGCAAICGFYEAMQEKLCVPVIDAALAPFKYAEFLADLSARFQWHPSRKHGSEAPPDDEINAWNLFVPPLIPGATIKAADQ